MKRGLIDLSQNLVYALEEAGDLHWNRFSAERYCNIVRELAPLFGSPNEPGGGVDGKTIIELGCGSWNPVGLGFCFLMLGARRCYAIDVNPVDIPEKAMRVLIDLAAWMIVDPPRIAGNYPVTREQVAVNLQGFDFAKLRAGDVAGIDAARMRHVLTSADNTPLEDGEADVTYSTSFLEHVLDADATIAELARITKLGGYGYHAIDATDHRRYRLPNHGPLDYLTEEGDGEVVWYSSDYGINRVRPHEFVERFEKHGFEVMLNQSVERLDPSDFDRSHFVEPYRSMSVDELANLRVKLHVRRR